MVKHTGKSIGKYVVAKNGGGGVLASVENLTLWLVILIGIMVGYLFYVHFSKPATPAAVVPAYQPYGGSVIVPVETPDPRATLSNPYIPPLKPVSTGADIRTPIAPTYAVPINVSTNSVETAYSQVGILTKSERGNGNGDSGQLILPLMGRNLHNRRDKWQYYTMSNGTGTINTKLPISVNGRSCTGEYGCDSISSGDVVYVDGYNDTFRATVYENALLQYLPL